MDELDLKNSLCHEVLTPERIERLVNELRQTTQHGTPEKELLVFLNRLVTKIKEDEELLGDLHSILEDVLDSLGFLGGGNHELEGFGITEERGKEIRAVLEKVKQREKK